MKRTIVYLVILLLASASTGNRTVDLTLYPAKQSETAQKYRLLPTAEELNDADAVPLYEKALQLLPDNSQLKQFTEWRKTPLDKLPVDEVQSALQKLKPTLELVAQAARCKQCNWPEIKPGQVSQQVMDDLSKYRQIAFILDVQARLQIARRQYVQAINTIQTSLAMARHQGQSPILTQGMVGIAIAALTLNQVEQIIQLDDAPSLYWALRDSPLPMVDLTKTMELEIANLKNYNVLTRRQFEKILKPAHDRVRLTMNRLDRQIAALQCIEALRLYAGTHEGKFPNQLGDITEVSVPDDPITQKVFSYSRTGSRAVLEGPAPEGEDAKEAIRYELELKSDN